MNEVVETVVGADVVQGTDELVWVVAEPEPAKVAKPPLMIKFIIDPEVIAKSKELMATLTLGSIFERLAQLPGSSAERASRIARGELARSFAVACGIGAASAHLAEGTIRSALAAEEYQARTGRPYPLCGPHRDAWTVTGRYQSVVQKASPFISDTQT